MTAKHEGKPARAFRPRGRARHAVKPLERADLEQGIRAMCGMRERGELSAAGLVDALIVLAEQYAQNPPTA